MHSNSDGSGDQFDASLKLPANGHGDDDRRPAADLIRKRVAAAYSDEPNIMAEEAEDSHHRGHRSKHQQFIHELAASGKPQHEVQAAWHEYYAGLPDSEKHQVWQEFYSGQKQPENHRPAQSSALNSRQAKPAKAQSNYDKKKARLAARRSRQLKPASPFHSLLFGVGIGSITILIFLFGFFNDRIIAPFIQPSRQASNIPLITGAAVGPEPEVIIPKINAEVPVVYDVNQTADEAIQEGLTKGVVHYPTSPNPGQNGNVVVVGHSSGNIFNLGNYKFAFSLLRELDNGDTFFLQKDGKRYTYQVYRKEVVKPTDVAVLGPADKPATATLITCDPPGLSTNRLVLVGQQISPDPIANSPSTVAVTQPAAGTIVPGNSPSLWSRITKWFQS
jgi:LPXTG-site transpeptidase (sortase) family protein